MTTRKDPTYLVDELRRMYEELKERGVTQDLIAESMETSVTTVQNYFGTGSQNKRHPIRMPFDLAMVISDGLGIPLDVVAERLYPGRKTTFSKNSHLANGIDDLERIKKLGVTLFQRLEIVVEKEVVLVHLLRAFIESRCQYWAKQRGTSLQSEIETFIQLGAPTGSKSAIRSWLNGQGAEDLDIELLLLAIHIGLRRYCEEEYAVETLAGLLDECDSTDGPHNPTSTHAGET